MLWRVSRQAADLVYFDRRCILDLPCVDNVAHRTEHETHSAVSLMKDKFRRYFAMLFCSLTAHLAVAQTDPVKLSGVSFPSAWSVADIPLVLNGAGVRYYSFLKIPVYAAAMYLEKLESDPEAILRSPATKVVQLKILRDVSQADSVKAWQIFLEANCRQRCEANDTALRSFLALIPAAKTGDTQTYVFQTSLENGLKLAQLEIFANGKKLGGIRHAHMPSVVLESWIGQVPTTEELKLALLGRR
jgi:Chalcone isomerase-like